MIPWDDIVRNVTNNLGSLDKETLERYLKVQPPQYNHPARAAEVLDIRHQMMRRIDQIEAKEREQHEEIKYSTSLHWNKIAAYAAIASALLVCLQIALSTCPSKAQHESEKIRVLAPVQNTQQPIKNRESLPSSLSSSTRVYPSKKTK